MITRKKRAHKLLKFAAEKYAKIPELIGVYVILEYDYRVLDFRYVTQPVPGGRSNFEISHNISAVMGELQGFISDNEKKYPFGLDGMGADDRGQKGIEYYQECEYTPVFIRG